MKKIDQNKKLFSKEKIISEALNYHFRGDLSNADYYYKLYIEKGYKDPPIYSNYGLLCKQMGRIDEAIKLYKKSISLDPTISEVYSNLGNLLNEICNYKEAELNVRKSIKLNPKYADAYLNLGNILKEIGKLDEAEKSTRTAIELKPNNSKAYLSLGSILKEKGNLKDAENSIKIAIQINPKNYIAFSNYGNLMREMGNLKDAELLYIKAIQINQKYIVAYNNLAGLLKEKGKDNDALKTYLKSIKLLPDYKYTYTLLTQFLRDCNASNINKIELIEAIKILLNRDDIAHKDLFKAFNSLYSIKIGIEIENFNQVINDELIILALKKMVFKDVMWEQLLTKIRRFICSIISLHKDEFGEQYLEFLIALAEQCFYNEYIYSIDNTEKKLLENIIISADKGEYMEMNISLLACYMPLFKLLDIIPRIKSIRSNNISFIKLIRIQVSEPEEEKKLSKSIKKLGTITNEISRKVKSQYEENPYPRWNHGNTSIENKITTIKSINYDIKPNYINYRECSKKTKILIAGCGTGQQIINSQRYKNAEIIGIDLSQSSLCYAQRKINDLGIRNVKLFQMDILEIGLLETKFDIIECCGVLHHMEDPSKGLTELLKNLDPKGFIRLSLYSELARQDVIAAREYIKQSNLEPSIDNIRFFRDKVISGEFSEMVSLTNTDSDFFTASTCRDLCFHYQEHRFTMIQLLQFLEKHQLKFLGFGLNSQSKSKYKRYFPDDLTQTNLRNWHEFEKQYPNTFAGTPSFWVAII